MAIGITQIGISLFRYVSCGFLRPPDRGQRSTNAHLGHYHVELALQELGYLVLIYVGFREQPIL